MCGGAIPTAPARQVVLSLGRMRRVREVDPVAGTITVEAGVVLADVQAAAAAVDRLFPLSLGSEGSCTIGGNIATNAGGTAVLRYGMMRDLVLGLEVVLPDGRVWDGLRALRKDNTGYDLNQLFIGAEGTLGVVTAAVLRLLPATPGRAPRWSRLPSVDAAVSAPRRPCVSTPASDSRPGSCSTATRSTSCSQLPGARDPFGEPDDWYGLVELAGPPPTTSTTPLETRSARPSRPASSLDAAIAGSPAQRSGLWALREGISEVQKSEGPTIKHDVPLPIAALAELVDRDRRRGWSGAARGAAGDLRPRRRRQPALQPERPGRRRSGEQPRPT